MCMQCRATSGTVIVSEHVRQGNVDKLWTFLAMTMSHRAWNPSSQNSNSPSIASPPLPKMRRFGI